MRRRDGTFRQVADELGVHQNTLRTWYMADEMARKKGRRPKQGPGELSAAPADETAEQRVARLERENAKLRKHVERLEEDRAILKKAAAFFARESE
jgi:transposase